MDGSGACSKPASVVVGKVGVISTPENGEEGAKPWLKWLTGMEMRPLVIMYIPMVFFLLMVLCSIDEFGGIKADWAIPIGMLVMFAGFIRAIAIFSWDIIKGFAVNIGFSIIFSYVAFMNYRLINNMEDPIFWVTIVLLCVGLPVWFHKKGEHVLALGSSYAAPICMFIIILGLLFGIFG